MGVNGEALQLHAVHKKPYFLLQVTRESISVLQVTWESVSGTGSHVRICIRYCKSRENPYHVLQVTRAASKRAMKSKVRMIKSAPSYTRKNITHLLPLALLLVLRTCNNTDGNKLVIFSGIASYYGDNYIILQATRLLEVYKVRLF